MKRKIKFSIGIQKKNILKFNKYTNLIGNKSDTETVDVLTEMLCSNQWGAELLRFAQNAQTCPELVFLYLPENSEGKFFWTPSSHLMSNCYLDHVIYLVISLCDLLTNHSAKWPWEL